MAGNIPIKDDLILTRGSDFAHTYHLNTADPDIPEDTTARIEITETTDTDEPIIDTWEAVEVGARHIRFRVESEDTDPIDDRTYYRLMVSIPDTPDNLDLCWYRGQVKRQQ